MPLLNVKVIENVFSDDEKKQMVEKLTDAMVTIEGENMRGVTWVIIEEVKSGDWGIGGNALTTADVKALAAGAPLADPTTVGHSTPVGARARGPLPALQGLYNGGR